MNLQRLIERISGRFSPCRAGKHVWQEKELEIAALTARIAELEVQAPAWIKGSPMKQGYFWVMPRIIEDNDPQIILLVGDLSPGGEGLHLCEGNELKEYDPRRWSMYCRVAPAPIYAAKPGVKE